jgi:hypothetical protein
MDRIKSVSSRFLCFFPAQRLACGIPALIPSYPQKTPTKMSSRTVEDRRKNFKKGIDADESRRRREEVTIALRKDKREEMISKRRQKSDDSENLSELANAAVGELSGPPTVGQIPGLMSQMQMQHDTNAQLQAVTAFRKLLSIGTLIRHNLYFNITIYSLFDSLRAQPAH